ncbi:MAG: M20 aminoacylase family protein [Alphaproteobacteria bacterium]
MPIENRFAERLDRLAARRRDLHRHPELLFDVERTAGVVARTLRAAGVDEVVSGLGRSGVVGVVKGRSNGSGRVVALRADMDALPIQEATGKPWASAHAGRMHACGHDGHTAMLLGAAEHLAETRAFDGTVVLVFQPAEEGGGGGKAMVEDGLMDRFGVHEVYAVHNQPGLEVGRFAIRAGPFLAAADEFEIAIHGYGGHAAHPHHTVDATLVGAHLMTALQTVVARNVDPIASAVLSVTTFQAGEAYNVIPQTARLAGTVRTLDEGVRDRIEARMAELVDLGARSFGAAAELSYRRNYPVLENDAAKVAFAAEVAREVAGDGGVDDAAPPRMGAEDFAFMLNARPGALIFTGNGASAPLHHPEYDFNDEAIPAGCAFWVRLAERALPLGA